MELPFSLRLGKFLFKKIWHSISDINKAIRLSALLADAYCIRIYTGLLNPAYYADHYVLSNFEKALTNKCHAKVICGPGMNQESMQFKKLLEAHPTLSMFVERPAYDPLHFQIIHHRQFGFMAILDSPHGAGEPIKKGAFLLWRGFESEIAKLIRKFDSLL